MKMWGHPDMLFFPLFLFFPSGPTYIYVPGASAFCLAATQPHIHAEPRKLHVDSQSLKPKASARHHSTIKTASRFEHFPS